LELAFWSDAMLQAASIPVYDVPFVNGRRGIGSFVTVDYLRIAGFRRRRSGCVEHRLSLQTYEYLTRVSQMPATRTHPLDSSSRPDNIWGFPSYALAETWQDKSLAHLFHVLVEPVFATTGRRAPHGLRQPGTRDETNPVRRHACQGRGTHGAAPGRRGYFTVLTPPEGTSSTKRIVFRSRFVHLAVGYPRSAVPAGSAGIQGVVRRL